MMEKISKIEELYVFLDERGVCTLKNDDLLFPLIAPDLVQAYHLKVVAEDVAKTENIKLELVRFVRDKIIEVIE